MSDTKADPHDLAAPTRADRTLRIAFRVLTIIEAFTWAGLIISMVIKYPLHGNPIGVAIFGQLHGITWIAFVIGCIAIGIWFRWRWTTVLVGILSSIIPFATIPFDIWVERRGRVNQRTPRAPEIAR